MRSNKLAGVFVHLQKLSRVSSVEIGFIFPSSPRVSQQLTLISSAVSSGTRSRQIDCYVKDYFHSNGEKSLESRFFGIDNTKGDKDQL
jgi:hypothetical protein